VASRSSLLVSRNCKSVDRSRGVAETAGPGYTQQRPDATAAHTFCLRTDDAGDHIDPDDQCFWIVAWGHLREALAFGSGRDGGEV
jgi:hypothetical protein